MHLQLWYQLKTLTYLSLIIITYFIYDYTAASSVQF